LLPAFPLRNNIANDSKVFAHQAASGWKPQVFLNVTAAPSFTECAVTSVASISITIHPVSRFPATTSHGNPPGRRCSRFHTCRRVWARILATLPRSSSSTAARVRPIVESDAGAPNTAACCAYNRSTSDMLTAPSTIPIAVPTSVTPRSHQPAVALEGITPDKAPVSPVRSAHARNNTAPA
jgi:hypothetical protein